MTEIFFDKLSYRFRSENDLSDFTWALGKSCLKFQHLFLKFFFEEISDNSKITVFKREHAEDYCRPDFYIRVDEIDYIIECKINDRNHHFEQYKIQFPKARFGYITNYILRYTDKSFVVREWKNFKNYLQEAVKQEIDKESKVLIEGYIRYLVSVCGIYNLKKMELSNLSSLYRFNQLIKKVTTSLENHETGLYNQLKSFDNHRSGQYFSLKINDALTIYPWLGIYYDDDRVWIYFEVNEKWCKPIYTNLDATTITEGEFYEPPYYDNDYESSYCFELKEKYFKKFNEKSTEVEEQEYLIKSFVTEVLQVICI